MKFFIEKCVIYKKNVYAFDDVSKEIKEQMNSAGLKLYTPVISKNNVPLGYEGTVICNTIWLLIAKTHLTNHYIIYII